MIFRPASRQNSKRRSPVSNEYFEEEEFTTGFNGKTLLRILKLTLPHWKWVLGFLLTISLVSALDSLFTYLSKMIVDQAIVPKDGQRLVQLLTIYSSFLLVQAAGVFSFIYLAGVLGERIRYDLRKKMFNHLQRLSLSYYSKTPVGWIMSRVTSDSDRVADLVTWGMLDTTWGTIGIITSLIFMFIINWKLALIVSIMIPILIYVAIEFRKRILDPIPRGAQA